MVLSRAAIHPPGAPRSTPEGPEETLVRVRPEARSKSAQRSGTPELAVCSSPPAHGSVEEWADVDELLRTVRSGLDQAEFSLLYLWIKFRANGGDACRSDLGAVVHGRKALSDRDTLVLMDTVTRELHHP